MKIIFVYVLQNSMLKISKTKDGYDCPMKLEILEVFCVKKSTFLDVHQFRGATVEYFCYWH